MDKNFPPAQISTGSAVMGNEASRDFRHDLCDVEKPGQFHRVLVEPDYSVIDQPILTKLNVSDHLHALPEPPTTSNSDIGNDDTGSDRKETADVDDKFKDEGEFKKEEVDDEEQVQAVAKEIVDQVLNNALAKVKNENGAAGAVVLNGDVRVDRDSISAEENKHTSETIAAIVELNVNNETDSELVKKDTTETTQETVLNGDVASTTEANNNAELELPQSHVSGVLIDERQPTDGKIKEKTKNKVKKSKSKKAEKNLRERELIESVKEELKESAINEKKTEKGKGFMKMFKFSKRKPNVVAEFSPNVSDEIVNQDANHNEGGINDSKDAIKENHASEPNQIDENSKIDQPDETPKATEISEVYETEGKEDDLNISKDTKSIDSGVVVDKVLEPQIDAVINVAEQKIESLDKAPADVRETKFTDNDVVDKQIELQADKLATPVEQKTDNLDKVSLEEKDSKNTDSDVNVEKLLELKSDMVSSIVDTGADNTKLKCENDTKSIDAGVSVDDQLTEPKTECNKVLEQTTETSEQVSTVVNLNVSPRSGINVKTEQSESKIDESLEIGKKMTEDLKQYNERGIDVEGLVTSAKTTVKEIEVKQNSEVDVSQSSQEVTVGSEHGTVPAIVNKNNDIKDNIDKEDITENTTIPESIETTIKSDIVCPENTEITSKLDNTEANVTPDNTEIAGKIDSIETTVKPDSTEATLSPENIEIIAKLDHTETNVTPDNTESTGNTDNIETTVKPDSTEATLSPENTETIAKLDHTETNVTPDNTESTGKTDNIETTVKPDSTEDTFKPAPGKLKKRSWSFQIGSSKKKVDALEKEKDQTKDKTSQVVAEPRKPRWRLGKLSFRKSSPEVSASTPNLNETGIPEEGVSDMKHDVKDSKKKNKLKKIKAKKEKKKESQKEAERFERRSNSLMDFELGDNKPGSRRSIVEDDVPYTQTDAFAGVDLSDLSADEDGQVSKNPAGPEKKSDSKSNGIAAKAKGLFKLDKKKAPPIPEVHKDKNVTHRINLVEDGEYAQIKNEDVSDDHEIDVKIKAEKAEESKSSVASDVKANAPGLVDVVKENVGDVYAQIIKKGGKDKVEKEQVEEKENEGSLALKVETKDTDKEEDKTKESVSDDQSIQLRAVPNVEKNEAGAVIVISRESGDSNPIDGDESFSAQVLKSVEGALKPDNQDTESDAYVQLEQMVSELKPGDLSPKHTDTKPNTNTITALKHEKDNLVDNTEVETAKVTDKLADDVAEIIAPVNAGATFTKPQSPVRTKPRVVIMKEVGVQAPDIHMPLDIEKDFGFSDEILPTVSVGVQVSDGSMGLDQTENDSSEERKISKCSINISPAFF